MRPVSRTMAALCAITTMLCFGCASHRNAANSYGYAPPMAPPVYSQPANGQLPVQPVGTVAPPVVSGPPPVAGGAVAQPMAAGMPACPPGTVPVQQGMIAAPTTQPCP
jgi:hypothetical protein